MTVGERIKKRREELNLTQDELAKKVGYKSRSSINKIEMSRDLPLRKVEKMAAALETTPSDLMGWKERLADHYVRLVNYQDILSNLKDSDLELLKNFHTLNSKGQEKVLSYARDLSKVDLYVEGIGLIEVEGKKNGKD